MIKQAVGPVGDKMIGIKDGVTNNQIAMPGVEMTAGMAGDEASVNAGAVEDSGSVVSAVQNKKIEQMKQSLSNETELRRPHSYEDQSTEKFMLTT